MTQRQEIEAALDTAKRNLDSDPHLANFVLRDLPVMEDLGLMDRVWTNHKAGFCHKNDVKPVIEKLERYLEENNGK